MRNKINCKSRIALNNKYYREKEFDIIAATKKIEVETIIPFDSSAIHKQNAAILH